MVWLEIFTRIKKKMEQLFESNRSNKIRYYRTNDFNEIWKGMSKFEQIYGAVNNDVYAMQWHLESNGKGFALVT